MKVEVLPSESEFRAYSARLVSGTAVVAQIQDAPHEIATQWANNMKDLHDDVTEIKYIGICMYCGSADRNGVFCVGCQRVVR